MIKNKILKYQQQQSIKKHSSRSNQAWISIAGSSLYLIQLIIVMQGAEQDRKLRQRLKAKDIDFQQQLRDEMQNEEENLKKYFKQFKKPVPQDPTKIKRSESAAADRTMIFKQALKPFTLFSTFYEFWKMSCETSQQQYVLDSCKKNYMKNMVKGIGISLLITSFISFRLKNILPPFMHLFGFGTALMSGCVYGATQSTKYTLVEFQKLGQGFELGRIAISEIEKYRMDRPMAKQI